MDKLISGFAELSATLKKSNAPGREFPRERLWDYLEGNAVCLCVRIITNKSDATFPARQKPSPEVYTFNT